MCSISTNLICWFIFYRIWLCNVIRDTRLRIWKNVSASFITCNLVKRGVLWLQWGKNTTSTRLILNTYSCLLGSDSCILFNPGIMFERSFHSETVQVRLNIIFTFKDTRVVFWGINIDWISIFFELLKSWKLYIKLWGLPICLVIFSERRLKWMVRLQMRTQIYDLNFDVAKVHQNDISDICW